MQHSSPVITTSLEDIVLLPYLFQFLDHFLISLTIELQSVTKVLDDFKFFVIVPEKYVV